MAFVWAPVALLGILGSLPLFVLAALLYGAGPRRRENILYACLLVFQGSGALFGAGLMYLTTDAASAYALQLLNYVCTFATLGVMLLFVGTLDSPLSRPFASRSGVALVVLLTGGAIAYTIAQPSWLLVGVEPATYAPWDGVSSSNFGWLILGGPLVLAFALTAAIDAARRAARGSVSRKQGVAIAWAFGLRMSGYAIAIPLLDSATVLALALLETAVVLQAAVLVHAIVKNQLFDIDLKIKWTIRKGTVAAAFVGVFFVVSEGAQTFLSDQMGPLAGLLAAGVLVFAMAPLQRVAERVSDMALPGVKDTAEYRTVRKREVYRAAVEGALEDGAVSDRERAMLARLADQLGLGPLEMHDIEREAREAARTVA